jgi:hypothetical protein
LTIFEFFIVSVPLMFFFRITLTLLDLHIPEDPADSVVPVLKPIDLGKEPEPARYKAFLY